MQKKYILILILTFISGLVIGAFCSYMSTRQNINAPIVNNGGNENTGNPSNEENNTPLDLPTEGNDTILTTKSDTTLRVVNEYDKNFITAKKNLLIMFASWCPNCQAEISEIEKILQHYKNC